MIPLHEHLRSLGLEGPLARQALRSGKVRLGGLPVDDGARVVDPRQVVVDRAAPRVRPGHDAVLVHRDDHLTVWWKPPSLDTWGPRGREGGPRQAAGLVAEVRRTVGEVWPITRLEPGVSGLVLLARTRAARSALEGLHGRDGIVRTFVCLVRGVAPPERLVEGQPSVQRPDAPTPRVHLRRLEALEQSSLVAAVPVGGGARLVRSLLESAGHPVRGDGPRRGVRPAMDVGGLELRHPFTGRTLRLTTPLPDDLERLRRSLSRDGPQRGGP